MDFSLSPDAPHVPHRTLPPRASRLTHFLRFCCLVLRSSLLVPFLCVSCHTTGTPTASAPPPVELVILPVQPPAQQPPASEPESDEPDQDRAVAKLPFVGTWVSQLDGARLELTPKKFHLSFPYKGGTRENFADILHYNLEEGKLTIHYLRSLEDGDEAELPGDVDIVLYEIHGDVLQMRISEDGTGPVNDEEYTRQK